MGKRLSKRDIQAILDIINGWKGDKLTWEDICNSSSKILGKTPTRQSLDSFPEIKAAYINKKSILKSVGPVIIKVASLKAAGDRLARQQSEIELLKKQVASLMEHFVIWQYNAHKYGISENKLNEPLPIIDRGRDDS